MHFVVDKLALSLKRAKDHEITIFSIGVGNKVRSDELSMMSSDSQCVQRVDRVSDLDPALNDVMRGVCGFNCETNTTTSSKL